MKEKDKKNHVASSSLKQRTAARLAARRTSNGSDSGADNRKRGSSSGTGNTTRTDSNRSSRDATTDRSNTNGNTDSSVSSIGTESESKHDNDSTGRSGSGSGSGDGNGSGNRSNGTDSTTRTRKEKVILTQDDNGRENKVTFAKLTHGEGITVTGKKRGRKSKTELAGLAEGLQLIYSIPVYAGYGEHWQLSEDEAKLLSHSFVNAAGSTDSKYFKQLIKLLEKVLPWGTLGYVAYQITNPRIQESRRILNEHRRKKEASNRFAQYNPRPDVSGNAENVPTAKGSSTSSTV